MPRYRQGCRLGGRGCQAPANHTLYIRADPGYWSRLEGRVDGVRRKYREALGANTAGSLKPRIESHYQSTKLRSYEHAELEIYSMIGAEGFTRLVAAFDRQIPEDDLLGPIYMAQDLPGAEEGLRIFLIGRFGGPQTYIEQ